MRSLDAPSNAPRRGGHRRAGRLARLLLVSLALGASGCLSIGASEGVTVRSPLDDVRLERLAVDFYGRLANRRIDSIATYQDPSLREFFRSEDAFADYYADLVQALVDGYFEARRLHWVEIEGAEAHSGDGGEGFVLRVRMRGENGRPLRWWTTEVVREDRWVRGSGNRWWIEPGKV